MANDIIFLELSLLRDIQVTSVISYDVYAVIIFWVLVFLLLRTILIP